MTLYPLILPKQLLLILFTLYYPKVPYEAMH